MRRQRLAAGVGVVAVVVAAVVLGLVVVGSGTTGQRATSPATSTTRAPTPTTTTIPTSFAVGTTALDVTEPSGSGQGTRSLPTTVRYPTTGVSSAADHAAGPFPLVVFSGGYDIDPEAFATLLQAWASAGYVVADPVYPYTSPSAPEGLDEHDIVNHPGDLRTVITALLGATGPLAGLIDPHEIAVVGHSDGGDVSLAAVANSCCTDHRITAAVILSGAEWTVFGGTYFAEPQPPLLVVQGTDDDVNPPGCSVQLYGQATAPKYYLSLDGQTHKSAYLQPGPAFDIVESVTTDFLDGAVKHQAARLAALPSAGTVPGSSTLSVGTATGLSLGYCPGAPGS